MKTYTLRLIAFAILVFFASCSAKTVSSSANGKSKSKHNEQMESKVQEVEQTTDSPTTQLVDLLCKTSGLDIRGAHPNVTIYVRGGASKANPQSVLYVVDNAPMGTDYFRVTEVVDITRVKSVNVLKGGQASIYGAQGGGGVVVIKMKKDRED